MIGVLLQPDLEEMIHQKRWDELRQSLSELDPSDIAELLQDLPDEDVAVIFRILSRDLAGQVFSYLPLDQQERLIRLFSTDVMQAVVQSMTPDDRARLLEELPGPVTRQLLQVLNPQELQAVRDLLGYPPGTAGRYMTPQYVALPADMTAGEALAFIRQNGQGKETLNVVYIVDDKGILQKDARLERIVLSDPEVKVSEADQRPLVVVRATEDVEEVVKTFEKYDRVALPVTDEQGHMLGIITVDDVLDLVNREATEDIQKIGGMEALNAPYMEVGYGSMLKKRGGWLSVLFLGEMLTATAMGHFEEEIAKAVVLALFVPLIISSGGNSGSQAATIIVRSLALRELRLRDWWRVLLRELRVSITLGAWLGLIGFIRVVLWQHLHWIDYGEHYLLVGMTVWVSLVGVVAFGSLAGSMLPFILRSFRLDPATSSAPFVATLVDVTGLVIYFTVAMLILKGTLL